jgi:poly-beta-1,6-N-acetyl-D-glucosamine synthase
MTLATMFGTLMWASFLTVILFYGSYVAILSYYYRRSNKNSPLPTENKTSCFPTVSFLVPVYNEERIIAKKLQNIDEFAYPPEKLEIVFIDGCSTDKTADIIATYSMKNQKNVKLIKQNERKGYTVGVVEGIEGSTGEIVVATDAGSYHYPSAITQLVKHFCDPIIGAVTGKEIVQGSNTVGPDMEKSYRAFYDFMRKAETEIDSTPDSKGEILAVRRSICESLIKVMSSSSSFDSCVPYQAKLLGYRTIFDEQAKYYEYAPSSFNERMKVQARRATVLLGAMFLFKNAIFNKQLGKFGTVILPLHFVMYCILPYIFMIGAFSLGVTILMAPLDALLWVALCLALLIKKNIRSAFLSFIQSQFALISAIVRLTAKRDSLFIETIASTRK